MFTSKWRYIKGYLRIRISGNSVERFINLCANKHIHLWNIITNDKSYEANIQLKDFKKLKPIVRKTRTKVVITERVGFPFFIAKYRFRRLFFSGIILCIILVFYLSTKIWNISLYGNLLYSNENILGFLKENEIYAGIDKADINCFDLAGKIRNEFDNIIWVSVSVHGSDLVIHMKENNNSGNDYSRNNVRLTSAYDIIADQDCMITSIVTRSGVPKVKVGDSVKKGDILVSGHIPVYNDQKEIINYKYCDADADITGKTIINYEDIISLKYNKKNQLSTYKHQYYVHLGKWYITFGEIKNNYENFIFYSKTHAWGGISFGKKSVFPYTLTVSEYNTNQIQKILSSNYNYYSDELKKKGVVILQNNVKIYTWSDKAKAYGTILADVPVGQKKISKIIEVGDSIHGNDGNNN